ncbi:MAG: hypothetical protein EBR05_12290 [Marivivens sp.]|nr:hypothetical protein [Marivivens sp.]
MELYKKKVFIMVLTLLIMTLATPRLQKGQQVADLIKKQYLVVCQQIHLIMLQHMVLINTEKV